MDVLSYWSKRFATVQPLPGSLTTLRFGTRTSSRKVWQNGDAPLIRRIGLTVTPGDAISNRMNVMPSCFGTSGSVRTRQNIQSAWSAFEVHILEPLMT